MHGSSKTCSFSTPDAKAHGQEAIKQEDVDAVTIVVSTMHSKEANIAVYSTVIGTGTTRLREKETLDLGVVASLNLSTRS